MDNKTRYLLSKIGANIPKSLLRQGIKTEKDNGELRERAQWAMNKTAGLSLQKREELKQAIEKGAFDFPDRQVVDNVADKKIQDYVETEVKRAMKDGAIAKPTNEDMKIWQKPTL